MTAHAAPRHALVFGASGLVGRHLVLALAASGATVTAAVRSAESGARVQRWLRQHGLSREVGTTLVDFDTPALVAGGAAALPGVTEIHNCAGTYRFGMSAGEARSANVGIVEKLLVFAEGLPHLQRLVHVSGYRVGGQDPATVPWSDDHRTRVYRDLGAYEASKVESDALFQAGATARGIPWTIVNPASVIGDSATGESDQHIGLAGTIEQIWRGAATALPGGEATFLPVVTVDYLAAFMAAAATDPAAAGMAYWVLDDDTPPLADLLTHVGRHLNARVPRARVPVSVIKRLPSWITRADPETLTFMSTDRYPTRPAHALAAAHGIETPDVRVSLERWADYLVAHRFGAVSRIAWWRASGSGQWPMRRASLAASTSSGVRVWRSLMVWMRSIWVARRSRSRKLPAVMRAMVARAVACAIGSWSVCWAGRRVVRTAVSSSGPRGLYSWAKPMRL